VKIQIHTWIEAHACSSSTADALRKHDLIVICGKTSHHDTKDMETSSSYQDISRAIAVEEVADEGSQEEHQE
jgi:hypothetical protein